MAEQAGQTEASGGAQGAGAAELRAEVERLRGILVERDRELGRARGRLAEIDDHPLRYAGLILRRHLSRATAEQLLRRLLHKLRRRRG
jgi:hypothetical protein